MAKLGPHHRPNALAKLDGRTREAQLMRKVRIDLTDHIGGFPSATQAALIDRAAWLSLHVALMDEKTMQPDAGPLSERDSRQYLAWSNALTRILRDLGADRPKASKPRQSLADMIKQGRAAV
ncbi:MAG: hypothetical protein LCH99_30985 [Proteobacteria bacterium]|nr:hypothetical protein [Pseudomonadota bacterium]